MKRHKETKNGKNKQEETKKTFRDKKRHKKT